jgi:hypothetical protein
MVLKNEDCNKNSNGICTYKRLFKPQNSEAIITSATNATLVAFFDILENVTILKLRLNRFTFLL